LKKIPPLPSCPPPGGCRTEPKLEALVAAAPIRCYRLPKPAGGGGPLLTGYLRTEPKLEALAGAQPIGRLGKGGVAR
jgi:hypothetical protein